jgi:hypothetical protein
MTKMTVTKTTMATKLMTMNKRQAKMMTTTTVMTKATPVTM